jgi:hypothetical protein
VTLGQDVGLTADRAQAVDEAAHTTIHDSTAVLWR